MNWRFDWLPSAPTATGDGNRGTDGVPVPEAVYRPFDGILGDVLYRPSAAVGLLATAVEGKLSMSDQGDRGPPGEGGGAFASRLRELKEDGCAVLVTGDASAEVHTEICRRLLGDGSVEQRRRLLVFTNGTFGLEDRLPGTRPGGETMEVITTSTTRSAVVESVPSPGIDVAELGDASLGDLGLGIVDAIERIETRHGPLEPAELRFGLDSLSPLLDAHGEQAVFEFLTIVTRYLRAYDALGHVHLPVDRNAYVARLLAPLFDAIVEVRVRDGRQQQRWHLDDGDVTSRWLRI